MKQACRWAPALGIAVLAVAHDGPAGGETVDPGHQLRVDDFEVYYETHGAGEPLVLLHGFGGCGEDWDPVVERLAKHYRVIIPDLRGHGLSTNPAGTFTHRQAATDVFTFLDHLEVERFRAMGFSTGAMTLLHMATREPARIEAMVLIGGTTHFPEQARVINRMVARGDVTPETDGWFRHCVRRGDEQYSELLRQFGAFKDSYDDMTFTPPALALIEARTLVVHGDRDEFFPVDIAFDMYRAIPDAALWVVPHGGHLPVFGPHQREFEDVTLLFLAGEVGAGH